MHQDGSCCDLCRMRTGAAAKDAGPTSPAGWEAVLSMGGVLEARVGVVLMSSPLAAKYGKM